MPGRIVFDRFNVVIPERWKLIGFVFIGSIVRFWEPIVVICVCYGKAFFSIGALSIGAILGVDWVRLEWVG